jgi:hypothetical protein
VLAKAIEPLCENKPRARTKNGNSINAQSKIMREDIGVNLENYYITFMTRTKILALIAVSAMFFACGSQDGSPAELKNGYDIISPFDTLIAEFDSKIVDITNLNTNIVSSQEMLQVFPGNSTASSNKLYFIGTYATTPGGLPYFKPGITGGSIVFSNLKNEDGYTQKEAVLHFSTYRIFDSPSNSTEATADDIDSFDQEVKVTDKDGVAFAGVLDSLVAIT